MLRSAVGLEVRLAEGRNWNGAAIGAELGLLVVFVALAAGAAGRSAGSAAVLGAVLMLLLALPSLYLLLWGRGRSGVDFMSSLVGSILGKALVVVMAVAVVLRLELLPVQPFVFGMMAGWVV